jgi:hypothetical protein
MDQRIESFLGDVLAHAGEEPDAVREGVRVALADCEAIFRTREDNRRMRDRAARVCRTLCRTRIVAEMPSGAGSISRSPAKARYAAGLPMPIFRINWDGACFRPV